MNLFLFLVWLQMSAQPQLEVDVCPPAICLTALDDITLIRLDSERLIKDVRCFDCFVAADETDGKPPKGPLTTQHNHIEVGEFVEPVDVPAVQVGYYDPPECHETKCIHVKASCADKSRVLLTSEDGKKHCVKF